MEELSYTDIEDSDYEKLINENVLLETTKIRIDRPDCMEGYIPSEIGKLTALTHFEFTVVYLLTSKF